jgi:hypothetical protein
LLCFCPPKENIFYGKQLSAFSLPCLQEGLSAGIKSPTNLSPTVGQMACPHCGLKFERFDPQYLKAPHRQAAAQ